MAGPEQGEGCAMAGALTTIGFDADDTLWHNERFFRGAQERFAELLRPHSEPAQLMARLRAAERRNLGRYGYGVKGFTLSMIETAIEVTAAQVPASVIRELIAAGQELLAHPVELLPQARETLEALAGDFRILLITKGDLLDQERKLAASGLGDLFDGVEIVSEKTPEVYLRIFARHGDGPARAMMVGNALGSDVVPAIRAGSWGVHVPHGPAWEPEHVAPPVDSPRYRMLPDLGGLPDLVAAIA